MALQPGTRLGPYQIGEPLGAGGMGEVYRARDTRLDRSVAIKVMPAAVASVPELRERFDREARTISSLNHPHICALYDIGAQDGVDFLVMEYLEGETLAHRLAAGASRVLKLEDALSIAVQIADALDKAHRQGVVHRDLKPGNIMLTASGAKLLDFGLAKQAQPAVGSPIPFHSMMPTDAKPLTVQGSIIGTLQYMAPEQLEGREADARTDIFAFGAVLYETLTGRRAFEGKSQVSLIAAIVDHDPPPVSTLASVAPPLLDHLVRICLAKNPDKRWQSMGDVLLQLRLIAEGGAETGARGDSGTARRLRTTRIAAAALGIALAAATTVALLPAREPDAPRIQFDVPTPAYGGGNQIAVSPAGTHIAATVSESGGLLWVRALEHPNGQTLPGTEAPQWPFWSPDGRFVGFFAGGKLKRVDLLGAPPQTLADAGTGTGGTWNDENVIVFAPLQNGPLFRVSAAGGVASPLTTLDEARQETAHRHPWFLPDGRHFLFVVVSNKAENTGIYVGSLDSADRAFLVSSPYRAAFGSDHLLFMRENTLMAQRFDVSERRLEGDAFPVAEEVGVYIPNSAAGFGVSTAATLVYRTAPEAAERSTRLKWFDRTGKEIATEDATGEFGTPALSPDRQRIAISRIVRSSSVAPTNDLWILDRIRGTSTRFTFDEANDLAPRWSPDGSRIVFRSNRGGIYDLYIKQASGVLPEELLWKSDREKWAEDWSSDGTLLLFQELDPETRGDLWVLPLTGEKKPRPVVRSPFNDGWGGFSPDGRWVSYVSNESGRTELYVVGFPTATSRIQISTAGATAPKWRRDGRELLYIQPGKVATLMAVDISTAAGGALQAGVPRKLLDVPPNAGPLEMTQDAQQFLFVIADTAATTEVRPIRTVLNWTRR